MASSSVINSTAWKGIWRAEVSTECKNLAWRAYTDTLPVRSVLLQRGIVRDQLCAFCGEEKETVTHALLMCEEVKRIWFAALDLRVESLSGATTTTPTMTVWRWIDECVGTLDEKQMGKVCAVMWAIWQRRNAWVFLNQKQEYARVIATARSMFVPVEWQPPSHPMVKINFAAAVRENVGTGMGFVARDSWGLAVGSGTHLLPDECFEPEVAEALCLCWAMQQSGELGLSDVIFETDCERLYRKWHEEEEDKSNSVSYASYLATLVVDCKFMSEGSSLALVRPAANKVAQCLAALAFDYGDRDWVKDVPVDASPYLQADESFISRFLAANA